MTAITSTLSAFYTVTCTLCLVLLHIINNGERRGGARVGSGPVERATGVTMARTADSDTARGARGWGDHGERGTGEGEGD